VYVDGEHVCTVGEAAVARWRLYKGRELAPDEVELLRTQASVDLAVADGHRLLGHRARSMEELRRRLVAKEHPPEAVEIALMRLDEDGLLDDAAFARSYVADKRGLAGWGAQRIRHGLVEAGVSQGHIDAALIEDSPGDPDDAELRRALDVLRRRAPRSARPDAAARRRAWQLLLRHGFASGVAYTAIRRWADGEDG
jgi:regulatory protein